MGLQEKIADIEKEISRTQVNKATMSHLCQLRAKRARYRTQLMLGTPSENAGGDYEGFEVRSKGNARVALIGFPSVGKSTLLSKLTKTESAVAAYEFTTLTCVPGMVSYKDTIIQLLDLPGIIEGAASGKGRGRQVISVARTSDAIIMMLDSTKGEIQKKLLTRELETAGIRVNRSRPNISFRKKAGGGIQFNSTVPLTYMSEKVAKLICHEYKIHNAEILFREDVPTAMEDLIDVIEGNRVYLKCLYVYNKVDMISLEDVKAFESQLRSVPIAANWELGLDYLLDCLWEELDLIRLYTKRKGGAVDLTEPLILRNGSTVESVCNGIHRSMVGNFKEARVWGKSAKHPGQSVGLSHKIKDEDVIQIVVKAGDA